MTVRWEIGPAPAGADAEAVVRPVWAGEGLGESAGGPVGGVADGPSAAYLAASGFAGGCGQVLQLPGTPVTVLLGLGARPAAAGAEQTAVATATAVRSAAAGLARAVRPYRHLAVRVAEEEQLRPLVEGYLLGGYRFVKYRSAPEPPVHQRIDLITPDTDRARRAVAAGRELAAAALLARDLVNEPGEALTPAAFAERAAAVAERSGLACEVWDAERIAAEKLGGLLGVSRGSLQPPRLVRLGYRPARWSRRIALVGKGVTFDAGGLSLKPNAHLAGMKADMAGAAAVLGAMSALGALDCRTAVDAWLPLTENMPNADPIRVGDVLVMRDGTTVEICHADAEGRLIMADALVLAGETAPDAIIDLATLTDAAAIALGRRIAALMGTDQPLLEDLRTAAERAGEPLWPLPLPDAYRPQLRSRIADLVNYTLGTRHGTALLAGLFLREFVPPGVPWAHLDIQGTALCEADDAEWVAGATGFGVRTLIELLTAPPTP